MQPPPGALGAEAGAQVAVEGVSEAMLMGLGKGPEEVEGNR